MKNLLITFLFLAVSSCHLVYGQGWVEKYGRENENNFFLNITETEDNGYLALGSSSNPTTNILELFLQKTDIDGNEQWSRFYSELNNSVIGNYLTLTSDGGFMLMGVIQSDIFIADTIYLLKTDTNGIKEWSNRSIPGGYGSFAPEILQTEDGGYLFTFGKGNNSCYVKISSLGVEEWRYTILGSQAVNAFFGSIEILSDGYLLGGGNKLIKLNLSGEEVWIKTMTGETEINNIISLSDGNFMLLNISPVIGYNLSRRTPNGDEIWNTAVDLDLSWNGHHQFVETNDGGFVLVDIKESVNAVSLNEIVKVNSAGVEEWRKCIGSEKNFVFSAKKDASGKLIFAGYEDLGNFIRNAILIKTDDEGNLYTNFITGNVFKDDNQNCIFDEGTEDGFANRIVQAAGNQLFYGTSDEMGNYSINVDTGSYEISVVPPGPYWETCDPQTVVIDSFFTDTIIDLGIQALIDCPWLTVDISTPFLRRCFENNYTVHYCNDGTISAEDAYIEIDFDSFLEVVSSDLPWTSQMGNTYTFDVGTLDPTNCGSFNITTLVNCDSTVLGQTHCVEAHIFPDSICLPADNNWDGSIIAVEAACDIDSVRFQIRNTGFGNMESTLDFIIIEDEIMVHQGNFQLDAGQSFVVPIAYPANGSTYRIIAEQSVGYPGSSIPTDAIEGCGTTTFPVGFINLFSQGDGDSYLSIDCQQNIGSYDPNDKQAFPTGYDDEHFIWQNIDLEYKIRFQNTGTDTAFTVVIRDTISEHLDITSLQMGASSHTYNFTIDEEGILKVTFDNILLVDSTTNEPASHGFFKYKIKQQPDNPIDTMIYNEAAIYFDFNAPIITNETYHEVGEPLTLTVVSTDNLTTNNISLQVFPNPFTSSAVFELGDLPAGKTDFLLYDNLGRLVREEPVLNTERFEFYRKGLSSGLYFFKFRQDGVRVASGKMLAR